MWIEEDINLANDFIEDQLADSHEFLEAVISQEDLLHKAEQYSELSEQIWHQLMVGLSKKDDNGMIRIDAKDVLLLVSAIYRHGMLFFKAGINNESTVIVPTKSVPEMKDGFLSIDNSKLIN